MIPGILNLANAAGDSIALTITWYSAGSTPITPGTPIDLTGYTAAIRFLSGPNGAVLFDLNSIASPSANGSTIVLGGVAGTITANISSADAAAITSGAWELNCYDSSGNQYTLLSGAVNILQPGAYR